MLSKFQITADRDSKGYPLMLHVLTLKVMTMYICQRSPFFRPVNNPMDVPLNDIPVSCHVDFSPTLVSGANLEGVDFTPGSMSLIYKMKRFQH